VLLIFVIFCLCVRALFVFFLCLAYQMLPVSLDRPFVIAPSVFSNIFIVDMVGQLYHMTDQSNKM
jgi:hypothetical protein